MIAENSKNSKKQKNLKKTKYNREEQKVAKNNGK